MKWIKCVIFDVDGTIAQTNQLILKSFNYITEKYLNRKYTFLEITKLFGPPEEIAIKNLLGKSYTDKVLDEFLEYYKNHHKELAVLYPDIREILDYLKNRSVILGIFTGKGKYSTLITLEELEIKNYFDIIVTGNDVINHKPAGEGIRKIMEYFKIDKSETLMIGDSVADINAAKAADVKVAACLWDSYSKNDVLNMNVDFIFENTTQLKMFLLENA